MASGKIARLLLPLAGSLSLGTYPSSKAWAADKELPVVMVTVNKREQPQDQVAGSLSAFSRDDLDAGEMKSLEDVAAVTPGFSFQNIGQSGLMPPVMRGMTANITSFSSSAVLMVDGVATIRGQGFEDSLLGAERIEVLRGPQSTLYGRNAEAGVINVVTRKPGDDSEAALSLDTGSRRKQVLRAEGSRAIQPDTLYIGGGVEFFSQDGFVRNSLGNRNDDGRKHQSGRLALRWTPSAQTDASLRLSHREYDDGASTWGPTGTVRKQVRSGTPGWNRSRNNSISLDIEHALESGIKLRSITARNEHFDRILQDTDYQPAERMYLGRDYHFETLSQELRWEGPAGDSRWVAGLYADQDDNQLAFLSKTPLALNRTRSSQESRSIAAFTHWDIPLAQRLNLQLGARMERDEVRFALDAGAERQREWTRLTPKFALQYQLQPRTQLYASIADGFRAGGFNTFTPESNRAYGPEKVRSYEIGIKGSAFGKRLNFSTALYRMDIEDMQVQQMGSVVGQVFITNAATARSSGVEAELRWLPGGGWQLQGALGLNRTRFREFQDGARDYAGNRNPFAPDVTAHLGIRYDAPAGWFLQARLNGASRIYTDAANTAGTGRPGYSVLNLSGGYTWGNTELSAYVHNLGDRRYDTVGFPSATTTIYSPPREAGLRLTWRL